ncbi:MAG TPA: DUF1844 domain-containing protein, partial [Candidatus Krumholzibacterium sp.]|nr:DUF1844 domain-containing protein [Candidatus Krumholzibacterium sp.]
LFHHLVAMFQALAMQQMGKIMNPVTGKVERDLQQARITIDMIDMIQTKTAGNLTGDEKKLIDAILMDLRMNYVDETSRPQEDDAVGDEEKEAEETAGEGEGKDSGDQDVPESEENESDKSG